MKNKKVLTLVLAMAMVVGTSLSAFAADTDVSVTDNKIEFTAGGGTTTPPVDPEEPDEEGDPDPDIEIPTGNTGSLRLDIVPSFDFGDHQITVGAQSYYAKLPDDSIVGAKVPTHVLLTDLRGTGDGWSLSAKMTKQFTVGSNTLDGAKINLKNVNAQSKTGTTAPSTLTDGTLEFDAVNDKTIKLASASSTNSEGMGVTAIYFGETTNHGATVTDANDAAKSVELTIPATTNVYAGTYTATIQWTLGATP